MVPGQSFEYTPDISTLLHGNDSKLILFIDPNKEGLLIVMENSSSLWPVTVETTGIEETITLFEQEVIVNQLLLLLWSHGSKRVESSSKFTFERIASLNNLLLDFISLLSCNAWSKRISCQVTANSDTSRFDH